MTFTPEEMETAAVTSIRYYLNVQNKAEWTDEYIKTNFPLAIIKIIENAGRLDTIAIPGAKAISQGNLSVSFADGVEAFSITDGVKSLLPRPFIVGW